MLDASSHHAYVSKQRTPISFSHPSLTENMYIYKKIPSPPIRYYSFPLHRNSVTVMAIRLCGILAVAALLGTAEALVSAVIKEKKISEKCASPFRIYRHMICLHKCQKVASSPIQESEIHRWARARTCLSCQAPNKCYKARHRSCAYKLILRSITIQTVNHTRLIASSNACTTLAPSPSLLCSDMQRLER